MSSNALIFNKSTKLTRPNLSSVIVTFPANTGRHINDSLLKSGLNLPGIVISSLSQAPEGFQKGREDSRKNQHNLPPRRSTSTESFLLIVLQKYYPEIFFSNFTGVSSDGHFDRNKVFVNYPIGKVYQDWSL